MSSFKTRFSRPLTILLLAGGLLSLATMPGETYVGDPGASMEEAFQLVNHGHFWIPRENVRLMQSEENEGQYYALNERTGRFYSKYGVACTLILVPPVLAYKAAMATGWIRDANRLWCGLLNFYYWGFTLLLLALLFESARPYVRREWVAALWAGLVVYTTFLWYYTRGQSMELFQVVGVVGLFLCTRKAAQASGIRGRRWEVASWALLLVLALFKVSNLILVAPVLVMLARREWRLRDWTLRFGVPCAAIGVFMGAVFTVRFGAPWLTGYHQWKAEADRFVGNWTEGLIGFLFDPQKSIFLHFPLFAFALFGVRPFARRYPREFWFGFGSLLIAWLAFAKMPTWRGDSSYGPRYLLYYLPLATLPLAGVMEWTVEAWKGARAKQAAVSASVMVLVAFSSLAAQFEVNRQPFFLYWNLWNKVGVIRDLDLYLHVHLRPLPLFYWEARHGLTDEYDWFVLRKVQEHLPPDQASRMRGEMTQLMSQKNFFWF